jgi:inositol phosphorylceramide mannosyltransferase catalytic subunit
MMQHATETEPSTEACAPSDVWPIPPRLFQTWKSKENVPANFSHWRATFGTLNPRLECWLWDDKDNRRFIAEQFEWFLPTYERFPAEIFRADAVRYLFLYRYGGLYADMDTECLRPLDDLFGLNADIILGRMGDPAFAHSIPNAIMLARPRQNFWLLVVALIMTEKRPGLRPEHWTGPVALRRAVELYQSPDQRGRVAELIDSVRAHLSHDLSPASQSASIAILPDHALYPLNWSDPIHQHFVRRPIVHERRLLTAQQAAELFPKAFMVTYWAHSWEPSAS